MNATTFFWMISSLHSFMYQSRRSPPGDSHFRRWTIEGDISLLQLTTSMPSHSRSDIEAPLVGHSSSSSSTPAPSLLLRVVSVLTILGFAGLAVAVASISSSEGKDMLDIQKSIDALKRENELLHSQLNAFNKTLASIQFVADTSHIKAAIDTLHASQTSIQVDVATLKTDVSQGKVDVDALKGGQQSFEAGLSHINTALGDRAASASCSTTFKDLLAQISTSEFITIKCDKGCVRSGSTLVWGSNEDNNGYMGTSSLCLAAAHAGVINPSRGGLATITKTPGQSLYHGSVGSYGVQSDTGSECASSFKVSSPFLQQIDDMRDSILTTQATAASAFKHYSINCRTIVTNADEAGISSTSPGGMLVYLDRQDVQCGNNEFLKQFRLIRPSTTTIAYSYVCCTLEFQTA
jgi:hypothetical protein